MCTLNKSARTKNGLDTYLMIIVYIYIYIYILLYHYVKLLNIVILSRISIKM